MCPAFTVASVSDVHAVRIGSASAECTVSQIPSYVAWMNSTGMARWPPRGAEDAYAMLASSLRYHEQGPRKPLRVSPSTVAAKSLGDSSSLSVPRSGACRAAPNQPSPGTTSADRDGLPALPPTPGRNISLTVLATDASKSATARSKFTEYQR